MRGTVRLSVGRVVVTLDQANAVTPMTPPEQMTPKEKREFFQQRASMYRRVADSDPNRHFEALACALLEQEKADEIAEAGSAADGTVAR
ncbi:AMED_5909 family protein [Actinocrispum wychmicini]|uniref:Uncharacterized protein n=1 Tax=Actinocrispum wychmicini TaxID=1213861 RepID=A0A4V2S871_9PSEU|nr:AMED_5909 family protein [Actinocrispum wychmicini]TCO62710.1 hypothetical protein EV192_102849 [Actinocrispum wychmicini]